MSKGLEALKDVRDICSDMTSVFDDDLDIIEKELKAFEIIKEKKVNVIILMGCDSVEEYNKHPLSWKKLTQEEYDLLKKVLYEKETS